MQKLRHAEELVEVLYIKPTRYREQREPPSALRRCSRPGSRPGAGTPVLAGDVGIGGIEACCLSPDGTQRARVCVRLKAMLPITAAEDRPSGTFARSAANI